MCRGDDVSGGDETATAEGDGAEVEGGHVGVGVGDHLVIVLLETRAANEPSAKISQLWRRPQLTPYMMKGSLYTIHGK